MPLRDLIVESDPAKEAASLRRSERMAMIYARKHKGVIPAAIHRTGAQRLAARGYLVIRTHQETVYGTTYTSGRWHLTDSGKRVAPHVTLNDKGQRDE